MQIRCLGHEGPLEKGKVPGEFQSMGPKESDTTERLYLSLFLFGSVLFTVYGLVGSAWKRLI